MPQFVVPQFIDVEDKIIGPITTRQFIMGVVAALGIFLSYRFADIVLFVIQTVVIVGVYVLVAFLKVNGRPFYFFLRSITRALLRPQLRVWSKQNIPAPKAEKSAKEKSSDKSEIKLKPVHKPHPSGTSLSSLALLVDTGGKYRAEEVLERHKAVTGHASTQK